MAGWRGQQRPQKRRAQNPIGSVSPFLFLHYISIKNERDKNEIKIDIFSPVEVLQPVQVSTVSRDSATDILVITVAEKLRKGGSYALQIQFSGPVHGNKTEGLFRNSYKHARTKEIRYDTHTPK